jgi:flagellar protein FlbD
MRRRTNENQKIMDRAREARRERISGERERENYSISAGSGVFSEADDGGKKMIRVTRLSGEVLYLNVLQIESMESIPETKIKMMNGYYFLVKDSIDTIQEQIRAFINSCIVLSGKGE